MLARPVNSYLRGESLDLVAEQLRSLEPTRTLPAWFNELRSRKRPLKSDSKTLGTCVEKLLKAEIGRAFDLQITGSSASGVDIPELNLNTKATSDRQPQSSEPFKSAYERILGANYDILLSVYNGEAFLEDARRSLEIVNIAYLTKTEVADANLCVLARLSRELLRRQVFDEALCRRVVRGIVYLKKGKRLYNQLKGALTTGDIPELDNVLREMETAADHLDSLIDQPSPSEWDQYLSAKLDGKIGISFALQWRFQFRSCVPGEVKRQTKRKVAAKASKTRPKRAKGRSPS